MIKGALVEFKSAMTLALPNVVVFQFNPETMRHSWSQPTPASEGPSSNPLAVAGVPGETFSFSLAMDVDDRLDEGAEGDRKGIYSRLAALEMLMFPVSGDSALVQGLDAILPGGSRATPSGMVPVVLFVWGTGRILPVRLTALTITEKIFDADLNPTHADAEVELKVVAPSELRALPDGLRQLAAGAYAYSQAERERLALVNLTDAARATIGVVTDNLG